MGITVSKSNEPSFFAAVWNGWSPEACMRYSALTAQNFMYTGGGVKRGLARDPKATDKGQYHKG